MISLLLLLAVGIGQQPSAKSSSIPITAHYTVDISACVEAGKRTHANVECQPKAQPATIKCGKFQHAQYANVDCRASLGCTEAPAPKCVDDMHPLKESEYQEIMERLRLVDLALRETICSNMNWKESISINGKTTSCAKLKPNDKTGNVLPWELSPER